MKSKIIILIFLGFTLFAPSYALAQSAFTISPNTLRAIVTHPLPIINLNLREQGCERFTLHCACYDFTHVNFVTGDHENMFIGAPAGVRTVCLNNLELQGFINSSNTDSYCLNGAEILPGSIICNNTFTCTEACAPTP
jgi:hypothetical protein